MRDIPPSSRRCVIFDIDGTLAEFDAARLGHLVHGQNKQWQHFHEAMASAPLIEPVARVYRQLAAGGETVVLCSGRPEGWVDYTRAWLDQNDLPYEGIYLRPSDADGLSDPEVKKLLLDRMRNDGFDPWIVFDDRSSVVDFWRAQGLVCLQCAPGDF